MLEAVLAAEQQATMDYTERAKQADAFGDKGLAVQLEDIVRDESGHSEETERILRDWPYNMPIKVARCPKEYNHRCIPTIASLIF